MISSLAHRGHFCLKSMERAHETEGKPVADVGAGQDAKQPAEKDVPYVSKFSCD